MAATSENELATAELEACVSCVNDPMIDRAASSIELQNRYGTFCDQRLGFFKRKACADHKRVWFGSMSNWRQDSEFCLTRKVKLQHYQSWLCTFNSRSVQSLWVLLRIDWSLTFLFLREKGDSNIKNLVKIFVSNSFFCSRVFRLSSHFLIWNTS